MKRREFIASTAALGGLALLGTGSAFASSPGWVRHMRPLMGTFVEIAAYDPERSDLRALILDCFEDLERNVFSLSDYEDESNVTKLRLQKQLSFKDAHPFFLELSSQALHLCEKTKGMYQPLCFSLSKLWREAKAAHSIPDRRDIIDALKKMHETRYVRKNNVHLFDGEGGFDFGGIGKGYLAEKACTFLKSRGIHVARVACSGDIYFLGNTKWLIEIEDPRNEGILGLVSANGSFAVATSGDYRNCWFVNGNRYHHLIDPRTGLPERFCAQATVMHPVGAYADGLATALCFLPPEKGLALLKSFPGAEGLIVDAKHRLYSSAGFKLIRT